MINSQRDREINGLFQDFSERYLSKKSSQQIIDIITFADKPKGRGSQINNDKIVEDLQRRIREYENEISRLRRV